MDSDKYEKYKCSSCIELLGDNLFMLYLLKSSQPGLTSKVKPNL